MIQELPYLHHQVARNTKCEKSAQKNTQIVCPIPIQLAFFLLGNTAKRSRLFLTMVFFLTS